MKRKKSSKKTESWDYEVLCPFCGEPMEWSDCFQWYCYPCYSKLTEEDDNREKIPVEVICPECKKPMDCIGAFAYECNECQKREFKEDGVFLEKFGCLLCEKKFEEATVEKIRVRYREHLRKEHEINLETTVHCTQCLRSVDNPTLNRFSNPVLLMFVGLRSKQDALIGLHDHIRMVHKREPTAEDDALASF